LRLGLDTEAFGFGGYVPYRPFLASGSVAFGNTSLAACGVAACGGAKGNTVGPRR